MSRCHDEPVARWPWCAPTPRLVVVVLPAVSLGGALLVAEPWHELHAWFKLTSTVPSMWRAGAVITSPPPAVIVSWHRPQSEVVGCGGGGGAPWHEPHCVCVPSTLVHSGVVA